MGCGQYGDFLYDVAWLLFWQPWFPKWHEIDLMGEIKAHYAAIGLRVPHMDDRLRCYQVHIGLDSLVWNAYKENWAEMELTARRTLEIVGGKTDLPNRPGARRRGPAHSPWCRPVDSTTQVPKLGCLTCLGFTLE